MIELYHLPKYSNTFNILCFPNLGSTPNTLENDNATYNFSSSSQTLLIIFSRSSKLRTNAVTNINKVVRSNFLFTKVEK